MSRALIVYYSFTAQTERAMSLWPNKGEVDHRPPVGRPYVRLEPVAPKNPAVPDGAPAALRPGPVPVELRPRISDHRTA